MFEQALDAIAVHTIRRTLARDELSALDFPLATTVIFRVALPRDDTFTITTTLPDAEPVAFRHGLWRWFGFGLRVYRVDAHPLGLHGKPAAWFVFRGPFKRDWRRVDAPLRVGGRRLGRVLHRPEAEWAVANDEWYTGLRLEGLADLDPGVLLFPEEPGFPPVPPRFPAPAAALEPFGWPLPPDEAPGGSTAPGGLAPPAVGTDGNPCDPIHLAVGLSLQTPDGGDALSKETVAMINALGQRGYNKGQKVPPVLSAGKPYTSLDAMLGALKTHLRGVGKDFCKCPPDSLVLIVSAHGYGPSFNPTKKVAMHFDAGGLNSEWVPHAQFSEKLGKVLSDLGMDTKKVWLVLYSCRSGDAFNPGSYGKHMKGAHVITSTPDEKSLGFDHVFPACFVKCAEDPKVKSWADFVKCLKGWIKKFQDNEKDKAKKKWLKPPKAGKLTK